MKKMLAVLILLSAIVGGALWLGFSHSDAGKEPRPEVGQKLALADKFLDTSQASKALEVIDGLTADGYELKEEGELLRLQALEQAGRHREAVELAKSFLETYPESSHRAEAELAQLSSELAGSGLSNPVLRQSVEKFLVENPNHPGASKLQIALAEQEISLGDFAAAQRRLEGFMAETEDDDLVRRLAEPLGKANMEKLMSPALGQGDTSYTVESGDTINKIARDYGVTEKLLLNCNGIDDPRKLRVGQRLKVPAVDFSVHVDIAANTMILKNFGEFFKLYPVRTGREVGTTPAGQYKILNKKRNPTWRPGNGDVYLPGDPNNELGTRWMAFEGDILGIHGTIHDETVGEYASNGCIGLRKVDVEEFFDLVLVGTSLDIVGVQDLERHAIISAPKVPAPQR